MKRLTCLLLLGAALAAGPVLAQVAGNRGPSASSKPVKLAATNNPCSPLNPCAVVTPALGSVSIPPADVPAQPDMPASTSTGDAAAAPASGLQAAANPNCRPVGAAGFARGQGGNGQGRGQGGQFAGRGGQGAGQRGALTDAQRQAFRRFAQAGGQNGGAEGGRGFGGGVGGPGRGAGGQGAGRGADGAGQQFARNFAGGQGRGQGGGAARGGNGCPRPASAGGGQGGQGRGQGQNPGQGRGTDAASRPGRNPAATAPRSPQ